ncbi:hypothetical protein BaRGS_00035383 [Batillaria attramentaria]|uniref:MI domain-containing protein n=1 Tax=Batillaria attramentaria TaxID=370345 RepID=A0ABD0JET2_9CAEN
MKNNTLKKLQDDIRSRFGKTKPSSASKATKSRKARRKEARNEKKERRLAYYAKKHKIPGASVEAMPTQSDDSSQKETKKQKQKTKPVQKRKAEEPIAPTNKKKRKYEDAVTAREERELRQLEKQLKMKKKKSLPKAFLDDGLDYLLDVVDKDKLKMLSPDSSMRMRRKRFSNKMVEGACGKKRKDSKQPTKSGSQTFLERYKRFFLEEEPDDQADDDNSEESEGVREDIYGRLVDAKGNVLPTNRSQTKQGETGGGTYIPPARRAAMLQESGHSSLEKERLKKQMKGLLNRASESNMQSIASAVEDMYMNHSRAAVNESLFALIVESCVSAMITPDRFIAEMSMLVAILHGNVGSEVGSFYLEHLVKKLDALLKLESYGEDHTADNVLLLLAYLYNFKVAHHSLLFDIMTKLVDNFGEKDIELILLILKAAGFSLRKDDPAALGQQISAVQKKAQELESSETDTSSRVRYMLEVLLAVRNNNVRRVPGADTERVDRLRKQAGSFIRGSGLSDNQLNVGLKDFLQAEVAGRWWLVGSAWDGRAVEIKSSDHGKASTNVSSKVSSVVGSVSQKLVDVARKLHMNSDVRRSIFFVLMSSEDYLDAFQKVLQLGIKGQQEREIVVVAAECCKREAKYNPYYGYFLARLAGHDRRFMMALQFHMWDVFKTLSEMSSSGRHNMALLLAQILSSQALSLSVLKVLEFGALDKATEGFLKTMLAQLLTSASTSDIESMFRRVGQQVKLQHLAEGLRLFLASSLKVKKLDVDIQTLKKHMAVASTELSANIRTVL